MWWGVEMGLPKTKKLSLNLKTEMCRNFRSCVLFLVSNNNKQRVRYFVRHPPCLFGKLKIFTPFFSVTRFYNIQGKSNVNFGTKKKNNSCLRNIFKLFFVKKSQKVTDFFASRYDISRNVCLFWWSFLQTADFSLPFRLKNKKNKNIGIEQILMWWVIMDARFANSDPNLVNLY